MVKITEDWLALPGQYVSLLLDAVVTSVRGVVTEQDNTLFLY